MDNLTIHERGYTRPEDCAAIGHHYRAVDLRVCCRCGHFDKSHPGYVWWEITDVHERMMRDR